MFLEFAVIEIQPVFSTENKIIEFIYRVDVSESCTGCTEAFNIKFIPTLT